MNESTPPLFPMLPTWQQRAAQPPPAPKTEQARQLKRVSGALAEIVVAFLRERGVGGTFHGADLGRYVQERHACSPGSESRILRNLRSNGVLGFEVVNRTRSLYRITKLALAAPARPANPIELRRDLE